MNFDEEKKYQFKLCRFLIKRKLRDNDERRKIVVFKLQEFPVFNPRISDRRKMEQFKKTLLKISNEESDKPLIDIRNREILDNIDNLVEHYRANEKIRIKYKRVDLAFFTAKFYSKTNPNKFFLKQFKKSNKVKIYYNGKEIYFGYKAKVGILSRFLFGVPMLDLDREERYDPEEHNPDSGMNKHYRRFSYKISANRLNSDYSPGITSLEIIDLTCFIYYKTDVVKLELPSNLEDVIKKNELIFSDLYNINTKANDEFGIEMLDIVKFGNPNHNGTVKLTKIGERLIF